MKVAADAAAINPHRPPPRPPPPPRGSPPRRCQNAHPPEEISNECIARNLALKKSEARAIEAAGREEHVVRRRGEGPCRRRRPMTQRQRLRVGERREGGTTENNALSQTKAGRSRRRRGGFLDPSLNLERAQQISLHSFGSPRPRPRAGRGRRGRGTRGSQGARRERYRRRRQFVALGRPNETTHSLSLSGSPLQEGERRHEPLPWRARAPADAGAQWRPSSSPPSPSPPMDEREARGERPKEGAQLSPPEKRAPRAAGESEQEGMISSPPSYVWLSWPAEA